MRENWARLIVLITGILVILLSMLFARIQNPDSPPGVETKLATQGEQLFLQQGCVRCHSIKGEGGLTGVAKKLTDKELREWITGGRSLEGEMSRSTMKAKSKYRKLTEEQFGALIEFLRSQ